MNPPVPVPLSNYCTVPTEAMARLLASLLNTNGRVLEIGTGSGYEAAVLAEQCEEVVSVELNPVPGIERLLPAHVTLVKADGRAYDSHDTFDAVLITFAVPARADHALWAAQVREGGRLVVPEKVGALCRIAVYEKHGGLLQYLSTAAYAPFTAPVPEVE